MNKLIMGLAGASIASLLGACAAVPAQDDRAAVGRQECKVVYYDSAAESITAANRDMHRQAPEANTPAEEAYALSQVGKLQLQNERRFGRLAPQPNLLDDAQRKC